MFMSRMKVTDYSALNGRSLLSPLVNTSLNHIHQCYRQRFGIETSYRLKNLCRIRTTTKKRMRGDGGTSTNNR